MNTDGVSPTDLCAVRTGLTVVKLSPRRWVVYALASGPFASRDVFHGRQVFGPADEYDTRQFVTGYGIRKGQNHEGL